VDRTFVVVQPTAKPASDAADWVLEKSTNVFDKKVSDVLKEVTRPTKEVLDVSKPGNANRFHRIVGGIDQLTVDKVLRSVCDLINDALLEKIPRVSVLAPRPRVGADSPPERLKRYLQTRMAKQMSVDSDYKWQFLRASALTYRHLTHASGQSKLAEANRNQACNRQHIRPDCLDQGRDGGDNVVRTVLVAPVNEGAQGSDS
tara:strand:+ start:660 stop:1265 length:606 start_codon:yes stop_codon:yes gene_type:complete